MQATHQSSFGEDDKNVKQVQRLVDQGDEESEVFSVASSLRQARKAGMYKSSRSGSAKSCRAVRFDPAQQDNSTYYEANNYRDNIRDIRQCFPQPVSDRCHDAYFGFTIMRALDQVDSLKSKAPILGKQSKNDYALARQSSWSEEGETVEEVNAELVRKFEGMPLWGHPLTQINVICPTTIPSIVGTLLASTYNPNLVADDYSCGVAQAEVEVASMIARVVGFAPEKSAGVFTFGGTGTVLYGAKMGIEKAIPGAMMHGLIAGQKPAIIASETSHYCRLTVAGWLGLGQENVISVETNLCNEVNTKTLEKRAREAIEQGKRIACIIATMGTTDALGLDDLVAIVRIRDRLVEDYSLDYVPHVHADAVIGWAWSVLNDYDFDENPLGFRQRTVHALRGVVRHTSKLRLADSIGIDFHKTGFCPYSSSMVLVKDKKDLTLLAREKDDMPYLFQSGSRHPGKFTLEASRSGGGVLAAYANLRLFGKNGMRSLIGHLVEMAELVREHLEGNSGAVVLNTGNYGSCTLFRLYPDGVDTWDIAELERTDANYRDSLLRNNEYNRLIYDYMHKRSMAGLSSHISMTSSYRSSDYGEPILALKSYIMSPFVDETHIEAFIEDLKEVRRIALDASAAP